MSDTPRTIILAGGAGTRLSEETIVKPKPMVEIGGRPILWHIMKTYAHYGFKNFVIALGYKGEMIKDYFLRFTALSSNLSVDLGSGEAKFDHIDRADWKVQLIDTGLETQTGGRVKRLRSWVDQAPLFLLTYGDGLSDVNVRSLVNFHRSHGKLATVLAVRPPARFGALRIEHDQVVTFAEKPQAGDGWINGGYFVLDPRVIDYIEGDQAPWEGTPLERLTRDGQLMAFRHDGFWHPMDTLRERNMLDRMWTSGRAPWKVWE